ncbi:uncharacterized protein LOC109824911 [Asparagus officinalis]|nr:uncharacterized protein LOC109824911 [Asparagus officinalis]
MIGNKNCVFGIDDIHRITGLPKEGIPIKMSGAAANTIYTYFVKNYKKADEEKKAVISGKRDRMAEMIVDMINEDPIICVKLIVAFIIGFILCPRTCKTCPLWAFRYAEQLSTLHKYNWCHAVFTLLCKEMSKSKKSLSMRELGQRSNAGYMGGFSSVLLVWFYEKVGELEYTSDIERLPPLFCVKSTGKWRRTTMNKLYRVPKLVTDNGQENTPLIHTASPIVFESRKAELIFLIAEKTYELNELTTELRELEERSARCQKKTKEKEDDGNVTEEKKIKEDMEAKEYENLEGTGEADLCDDFVMSARDVRILEDARDVSQKDEGGNENNRETPSIKRAVGKRERKDGPSVTSPYMPLDQPKEGTKKRRVIQILDSPDGKKSTKMKKASYLHLETIQVRHWRLIMRTN